MSWAVNGIPAHPLLVHAVVVLVPLAALAAIAAAAWPAARRRLGVATPVLASAGAVSAALAIQAGEWLEEHVTETSLVEKHTANAEIVVPWLAAFVALAWAHWAWHRFDAVREATTRVVAWAARPAPWVLGVGLVIVAIGSIVTVIIVGDAGAKAVWSQQTR